MDKVTLQVKLGDVVRAPLDALGYSQDIFADAISMHRIVYRAIERSECNVIPYTVARVTDGLDVRIAELMAEVSV
jgi:hypothetical protein